MTKICMLAVWIGKLPDTFELWKYSVLCNPTIDFYLISDNKDMVDEKNLKNIYMSFDMVRERYQSLFDFDISLDTPYKLCDYKPIIGEAFKEITEKYDFWGHMDLDILLGDVRAFLTDEFLEKYDKVFEAGCFILYRNTDEMRQLYKLSMNKDNMAYPYKKAFTCRYACYFDEYMGMNILDWQYGIKVYIDQDKENMVQDFSWKKLNFCSYITKESFVFRWKEGKLFRYLCDESGRLMDKLPKEYLLVHIQKRKMEIDFSMEDLCKKQDMWIVPNRYQLEQPQNSLYSLEEKQQYEEQIKQNDRKRSVNNLKKFGIINYIPHFIRSRRIRKWIFEKKGYF